MNIAEIFKTILILSLMGSVVAVLILLIRVLLKNKLSANWHHVIWFLLVIRLIVPYGPESTMSIFNYLYPTVTNGDTLNQMTSNNHIGVIEEAIDKKEEMNNSSSMDTKRTVLSNSGSDSLDTNNSNTDIGVAMKDKLRLNYQVLSLIWLAGVIMIVFWMMVIYIRLYLKLDKQRQCNEIHILEILEACKTELNIRRSIPILYSKEVKSPALIGLIRPKILVPNETFDALTAQEKRYVFLHELGHLKRKDILVNWINMIIQILHWFNPFLWYAFNKMKEDAELACDAYVLSKIQDVEHKAYGKTLVNMLSRVVRPYWVPTATGMAYNSSSIERRLKMITRSRKRSFIGTIVAVMVMLLIGCVGLTNSANEPLNEKEAIIENVKIFEENKYLLSRMEVSHEDYIKAMDDILSKDYMTIDKKSTIVGMFGMGADQNNYTVEGLKTLSNEEMSLLKGKITNVIEALEIEPGVTIDISSLYDHSSNDSKVIYAKVTSRMNSEPITESILFRKYSFEKQNGSWRITETEKYPFSYIEKEGVSKDEALSKIPFPTMDNKPIKFTQSYRYPNN